ncbi:hypothetical protein FOA52_002320 [Chlamydomonas sp. UWO 241]|nr:hypothetical protein FOA52_002320 [Chlamydomonas sp. UWO 241]
MSKVSGGGAARRGMKTEEDAMQRLAISTQARGRASKANKSPPHAARLTRGAAMRLAETEATSDDDMDSEGSPTQATGGRWGSRDQGHLPAAPPPHLLLSAKKSNRPPPIVVSEKAAALGRHLIMNPLLGPQMSDGGHNSRCSSRGPSASPATPAAAAISACHSCRCCDIRVARFAADRGQMITIVSAYSPTEAASDEEAGDFYLRVAALADKANDKRDLLIVAAVQRDRERWIGQQVAEAQDMLRKKNLRQFARACDRLAGRSRSHQIPPAMRDVSGALHSGPDGVLKAMTESFDKLYGGETKLSDETLNQLENDVAAFELTRATEVDEAHGRPPDLAETEACVRALRSAAAPGGDQLDAMLLRAPAPSMGAHARTAYESRRKALPLSSVRASGSVIPLRAVYRSEPDFPFPRKPPYTKWVRAWSDALESSCREQHNGMHCINTRCAARAIAAAVAAGPAARLTRSQHAALEAGGSAKHRPMDRITETPPSASALAEAAARGHPVSIALPPCVPSIDRAALSFEPSASRTLGSGSYGIVYEGRYMGQPVAVKVQELSLQNQDDLDELSVEAVLGSSLHHPGLLRTMAASVYSFPGPTGRGAQPSSPRHEVHMVMELMPDGNALAVFEGRSCLDLATLLLAANIAEQVAWALDFLHSSCGMLHLDVKGANVLVRLDDTRTASVVAKLADFGLTVKRHDAINEEGGMRDRGTPRYMGPEFWDDDLAECIGEAADVYALGCVMWEMASRGAAFLADRSDAQVARAKGKASVPMPTGTAHLDKYSALAQRCRCVNPDDRPRVRDVALELKALCEKLRARLRLP